jgi:hypothetical protein
MFYRTIHIEYKFTSIMSAMFYRTIHIEYNQVVALHLKYTNHIVGVMIAGSPRKR